MSNEAGNPGMQVCYPVFWFNIPEYLPRQVTVAREVPLNCTGNRVVVIRLQMPVFTGRPGFVVN